MYYRSHLRQFKSVSVPEQYNLFKFVDKRFAVRVCSSLPPNAFAITPHLWYDRISISAYFAIPVKSVSAVIMTGA
jgi:hypothetical protein